MKKLAVFFIVLVSLMVIAGCNTSKKSVTRFSSNESSNGVTTTITKIDNGDEMNTAVIEIPETNEDADEDAIKTTKSDSGEAVFAVTSPADNTLITDKGYHLIQGTTPKNTDRILVNDSIISKYKAGGTQWNYIAAASLGTLLKGENSYTVSAFDKNGKTLGTKNFTIIYKGIDNGALADTGSGNWLLILSISFAICSALFFSFRQKNSI